MAHSDRVYIGSQFVGAVSRLWSRWQGQEIGKEAGKDPAAFLIQHTGLLTIYKVLMTLCLCI